MRPPGPARAVDSGRGSRRSSTRTATSAEAPIARTSSRAAPDALDLFAITAPGLAYICARELEQLGAATTSDDAGVAWRGDLRSLYRANLELRTASRVVARAGAFRARTFAELERHAARLPWQAFLAPGTDVALRVTCRKSKLYHEGAVAERIASVIADCAGAGARLARGADDDDGAGAATSPQLVIVRFMRDECTISIDASGALLHQRGYRQALAKAPLRETIAAAMLIASGWDGAAPLLDPFCGSGTIAIEAALLARRIAPGLANAAREPRPAAFMRWPGFDAAFFDSVVRESRDRMLERPPGPILGSDRNGGAITAARANAARAGVAGDIVLERQPLGAIEPPTGPGWLVTNPPYGVRVGERRELFALYAALGRTVRDRLGGWSVAILSGDAGLAAATGLSPEPVLETRNGGIAVQLLRLRSA